MGISTTTTTILGLGTISQSIKRATLSTSSLTISTFTSKEFRFLLLGQASAPLEEGTDTTVPHSMTSWLSTRAWIDVMVLSTMLPIRSDSITLIASFVQSNAEWKIVYDAEDPDFTPFPDGYDEEIKLSKFQRLCLLRCLRPDKVVPSVVRFVASTLGHKFTEPPSFDLASAFKDSSNIIPIVFVLSPGTDPMANILRLANKKGSKVDSLSLGKGQGPVATKMVNQATVNGSWAVLQNCHLFPSWMSTLAEMVQTFGQGGGNNIHESFRLWLTSYPSNEFPVSILQNSVKLTNEPPNGIRANLMRSYGMDPISSRTFFHAVVQERRQFGPLGWNIPYEFNDSDLEISVRQLRSFLEEASENTLNSNSNSNSSNALEVPFKKLRYVIGQCNYGGRVTDDKDRRLIGTILEIYFQQNVLNDRAKLSSSGTYFIPSSSNAARRAHRSDSEEEEEDEEQEDDANEEGEDGQRKEESSVGGTQETFLSYIRSLPLNAAPEVFAMHPNASITKEKSDTQSLFDCMLLTAPSGGGGSEGSEGDGNGTTKQEDTPESIVDAACTSILLKLPKDLDVMARLALEKYPVSYGESMNTVICQELGRFANLLTVIESSLIDVQKALKGLVVMNTPLQLLFEQLLTGKLPSMWSAVSYPSLKPVDSYVSDLILRINFFSTWFDVGLPVDFWLPGFFFTQSFLTGALQNYARKYRIPIDTLEFDFYISNRVGESVIKNDSTGKRVERPEDGVIVWGLFLDGAAFNFEKNYLIDPKPKELFSLAPGVWIKPVENVFLIEKEEARVAKLASQGVEGGESGEEVLELQNYSCPMYKTSERRGVLSTTGQSTNFVMSVRLPCKDDPSFWILRGTALLTQLDE